MGMGRGVARKNGHPEAKWRLAGATTTAPSTKRKSTATMMICPDTLVEPT
jgi:hypothetical protein